MRDGATMPVGRPLALSALVIAAMIGLGLVGWLRLPAA